MSWILRPKANMQMNFHRRIKNPLVCRLCRVIWWCVWLIFSVWNPTISIIFKSINHKHVESAHFWLANRLRFHFVKRWIHQIIFSLCVSQVWPYSFVTWHHRSRLLRLFPFHSSISLDIDWSVGIEMVELSTMRNGRMNEKKTSCHKYRFQLATGRGKRQKRWNETWYPCNIALLWRPQHEAFVLFSGNFICCACIELHLTINSGPPWTVNATVSNW